MATRKIFVNLKRFDIPRALGGVCPEHDPGQWMEWVIAQCVEYGLGRRDDLELTLFLPEGLLLKAAHALSSFPAEATRSLRLGCQGVFREDVAPGGNFGAFTTNRPASAARNMGCSWAMTGHSEERKDKLGVIAAYDPSILAEESRQNRANRAVDGLIHAETVCALRAGLNVLLCVGETAAEKGEGSFAEQQPRIAAVLRSQLEAGLQGVREFLPERQIAIAYEPVWAIGPGKTPPGAEYIAFVAGTIKNIIQELWGQTLPVVYGGGLKLENAAAIAGIDAIDGGLVALTRFSGTIGFEPAGLNEIIAAIDRSAAGR
ncbi:triosephosphate isomerase [Hydrogenispora ethanolica]|uniref:Triosephosphate isomerase n=1 Tax=Hydrogenispora ethanolica TaxID=1082276 RepID=A0A4V2QD01_HYDET|nr:triose-phosphate isomerase [Hydrogenispora ethanolica]TCL61877.1 triosephosphate isomerase [Hydrogenispora ethanolica]